MARALLRTHARAIRRGTERVLSRRGFPIPVGESSEEVVVAPGTQELRDVRLPAHRVARFLRAEGHPDDASNWLAVRVFRAVLGRQSSGGWRAGTPPSASFFTNLSGGV
jgi:hypothetical protein